jgi:hypothetical protein
MVTIMQCIHGNPNEHECTHCAELDQLKLIEEAVKYLAITKVDLRLRSMTITHLEGLKEIRALRSLAAP